MEYGFDVIVNVSSIKGQMYDFLTEKIRKGESVTDIVEAFDFVLQLLDDNER
ncbi:hypothetical protein [Parablautia sp. Marseille-Q6255]|uniref:hypothetical protein n=1 Tax=Parablautia sp. Marseille-Q6255 TaxID=3039593 RepID=UPI0024BCD39A|nr:hypothetical protein [Parablautia sp. Marseille-Q6255]